MSAGAFKLAAALLIIGTSGSAATIDLQAFGYARSEAGAPVSEIEFSSFDSLSDGASQAASVVATSGTSTGSSQVSVNSSTGEIKTRAATSFGAFPAEAGASAQGGISEQIGVSGSGTVTATIAYDGFWDLIPYYDFDPESYQYNIQGSLTLSSSRGLLSSDTVFVGRDQGPNGSVDGILEATIDVSDGDTLGIFTFWLSQIVTGYGVVDFSNTATLFLLASDGVSLSFSDPDFLSETPDAPAPIPLPAGLVLLLSALAALGAAKGRGLISCH